MCSQSSAIFRMSALSAGLSAARLFVGSAKQSIAPNATRIAIVFPDISILLLRYGEISGGKVANCPPGSRSKTGSAARIEIAKQIAIQPVEVSRCLDHQRQ